MAGNTLMQKVCMLCSWNSAKHRALPLVKPSNTSLQQYSFSEMTLPCQQKVFVILICPTWWSSEWRGQPRPCTCLPGNRRMATVAATERWWNGARRQSQKGKQQPDLRGPSCCPGNDKTWVQGHTEGNGRILLVQEHWREEVHKASL